MSTPVFPSMRLTVPGVGGGGEALENLGEWGQLEYIVFYFPRTWLTLLCWLEVRGGIRNFEALRWVIIQKKVEKHWSA